MGVDERAIEHMLNKCKFRLVKINNLSSPYANILKQEMLSIGGDVAVNKGCVNCSVKESDALVMGTISQVNNLIAKLQKQPGDWKRIIKDIETGINY